MKFKSKKRRKKDQPLGIQTHRF